MTPSRQRLYINIDHIATIRQARRGDEPVPVDAVPICERAGADGITAHLREDRRHIQDADIDAIAAIASEFNLEMACTAEMVAIAERLQPLEVTLVPEKRQEVTTEGGLAVAANAAALGDALRRLREAGIKTSLFIDPDRDSISRSRDLGAHAVELHTGTYAHAPGEGPALTALREGARHAASIGLAVHAGHGLTTSNVGPVAAIPEVEELNIGHHVVSRAVFVGLEAAVRELRRAMDAARTRP
ncbi:MAG: pyridoxine 5'-phosphate synthase [Gemmatimonadaceae bacterium]|nr:pyridoxine 5'-phosphate synthase [Gemmatimonadaceae bacterium]NUO93825.1 pyridoxine 5'-phosphate synthase [Gemmatimonadaceae bacterium]NUP55997.1 pyridoxine 5'-phosphate synthase [Gemmatimonadaceae bacterium]NUS48471.1 pyridoxine 5'-phosphate synthase [Gemmatimonadaceae bacterium]